MHNLFDLSDRVVIVTGAGRGLGRKLAQGLAKFSAKVVVCDISVRDAEETANIIDSSGQRVLAAFVDVTNRQSCEELLKSTVQKFGRVDVLVNNAAVDVIKPLEDLTESDWNKIIDVNLKGPFFCSQLAAEQMILQGSGGSIINISSIASVIGIDRLIPYSASKGGLNQLTRAMAVELAPKGIRVNAVAPGYIDNLMSGTNDDHERSARQAQIERLTPMGRRGKLEEFVGPVVFLASDASTYVTGAVLFVDGGYTAL